MRTAPLFALCLAVAAAQAAEPLHVAAVPWREPAALQVLYGPTVRLLERTLKRPVELRIARDYAELTERIAAGAADVAIYGPAGYVKAKARHPGIRYLATCLIPDDHYYSLLFVRRDSDLTALAQAKGRSVGFTDRLSTSGYLMPRVMLEQAGVNVERDVRVFMLNRNAQVFNAVAAGTIDLGAVHSETWSGAGAKFGDAFRVVAKSGAIPRDPVAAAPHLDAKLAAHIQRILAGAQRDAEFVREGGELKGYALRSDRFYDVIRNLEGR